MSYARHGPDLCRAIRHSVASVLSGMPTTEASEFPETGIISFVMGVFNKRMKQKGHGLLSLAYVSRPVCRT